MGLISGIVSAVGSLTGGLLSSKSSKKAAKISAKASKANTATQLDWERERAQNAIQWAKEDAIKAGINPAVAASSPAQTSSITPQMPDTSGIAESGKALASGFTNAVQLMQAQKKIDAEANLADAQARNKDVETGLKPRETAVKEMEAETNRRRQEQDRMESMARVEEIYAVLPYKTEQEKNIAMQEFMTTAIRLAQQPGEIEKAKLNAKVREITGGWVDADEAKKIALGLLGGLGYDYEKRKDRTSAEKISQDRFRNHREIEYNSRGKQKAVKYYEYQN